MTTLTDSLNHSTPASYSRGFALVLISAIGYGIQPFFAAYGFAAGADPIGLLLSRFTLASLMLCGWLWLRRTPLPKLTQALPALLVGVGYAGAGLGYYSASQSSSVSLAVILMFSFPAFVIMFSLFFLRTPTTPARLLALVLALSGVALASGLDLNGDLQGIGWALFAALSYGAAIVYGTLKLPRKGSLTSAALIMLGCTLTFALASLWHSPSLPGTSQGWTAIAGLALFATILPVATFISGAAAIGASDASTLSTVEPIVAVTIAVSLLGESLSLSMLAGGALVISASILLARAR